MTAAADFARPDPPEPAPAGYEWHVFTEDAARWALPYEDMTCRARVTEGAGPAHAHGAPAGVRKLVGVTRPVWWGLCAPEHSEGRWAEGGRVVRWQLREVKT